VKLTVFNGSPRGSSSNTGLLLGHFLSGFETGPDNCHEIFHLHTENGRRAAVAAFGTAETVLLAFPLYTDAMPGVVKEVIEALAVYKGREGNPTLLFLVQSGFPEGSHTRPITAYLEKVARRLGCTYLGTIRRGGVEGVRSQPGFFNRKLFKRLTELGVEFGNTGMLNAGMMASLAGPERLSLLGLFAVRKFSEGMYWNPWLRRNKSFSQRFNRPFGG
jgi:hypothetical protein